MNIQKNQGTAASCDVGEEELNQINAFAKTPLRAEEVYVFAARLCDNEVDRDFERFGEEALAALGRLFVGKTGIFDHQWSAEGQTARIYRTELIREPEIRTAAGDGSCWLKAWAYLLRSEKNAPLIAEIEGGIKKEVSVGCSVARSVCSICGAESGACEHVRGRTYGGKLCYAELQEPTDAYEWSFVAVPAQRKAGVVKKFTGVRGQELRELQYQVQLGRSYLQALRCEVVRLAMLCDDTLDGELFRKIAGKLEEPELLALQKGYRARARSLFPVQPQLRSPQTPEAPGSEAVFLV
ncbi:MAG: hypothetical protein LKJ80_01960 [Oscillibacter sp.]|jgi:hypothetical protein|nr:hypothetical protein [Oscillibacter sp.]